MATRWLKNLTVSSIPEQAYAYYWFMRHCLQWTRSQESASWLGEDASDSDGVILASLPTTFTTSASHFVVGDVGKWLLTYDPSEPRNTSIFPIATFVSDTVVTLSAPCDWQADASGIAWVMIDPANAPAIGQWATLKPAATSFQVGIFPRASGLGIETTPRGGNYNGSAWTGDTLGPVNLDATSTTLFAVGDDDHCIPWTEGGANRSAIYIGDLDKIVATDAYPTVLLGANNVTPIIDRDATNTASLAGGGTGYYGNALELPCHLSSFLDVASSADSFADVNFATNPRTSEADYFGFAAVYPATGLYYKTVQGRLKSIYMVNDSLSNRTLLDGDTVYVLENGIAVAWDTSTPI